MSNNISFLTPLTDQELDQVTGAAKSSYCKYLDSTWLPWTFTDAYYYIHNC